MANKEFFSISPNRMREITMSFLANICKEAEVDTTETAMMMSKGNVLIIANMIESAFEIVQNGTGTKVKVVNPDLWTEKMQEDLDEATKRDGGKSFIGTFASPSIWKIISPPTP